MGIPSTPPPVLPKDPKQREAAIKALRRLNERERSPFEAKEAGGWGVVGLIIGLAIGGFGG